MAKLYVVMGKDTIYKELMAKTDLKAIVMYTTRPMRDGESDGREYFFVSDEETVQFEKDNKIIEIREYNTVHGVWKYFTLDDGQIKRDNNTGYLIIATLEAYKKYSS